MVRTCRQANETKTITHADFSCNRSVTCEAVEARAADRVVRRVAAVWGERAVNVIILIPPLHRHARAVGVHRTCGWEASSTCPPSTLYGTARAYLHGGDVSLLHLAFMFPRCPGLQHPIRGGQFDFVCPPARTTHPHVGPRQYVYGVDGPIGSLWKRTPTPFSFRLIFYCLPLVAQLVHAVRVREHVFAHTPVPRPVPHNRRPAPVDVDTAPQYSTTETKWRQVAKF